MPTIEYSKVVGAGAGWTKAVTPDGRTVTVKGDRAVRNNNPGNLEYGPYAKSMGAIGVDHKGKRARGFAVFPSREVGLKAQAGWYAKEAKKHPDLTIGQAISKYAPSFENNTKAYTRALTKAGNITADTKLADISPEQMSSILSAQHAVEGNTKAVAYDAETGARIATIDPSRMAGAPQVAAAQPSGGLAAFFSDKAKPAVSAGLSAINSALGVTPAAAEGLGSVAPAQSQPVLSDPSFNSRFAAQPTQAQFDARFGAPAAPDASRFAPGLQAALGPVSPETYAEAKQPASAKARSAFDAIAAGLGAPDQSTPASNLGAQIGAMAAPQAPTMKTDAKGTYADPFSSMRPGIAAQAAEMPAEASAFTEQPHTVTTQAMRDSVATQPGAVAPGLGAPQDVKDYNVAGLQPGLLSPNMMAPGLQASSALGLMPGNTNTLQPFDKPSQFATPTIDDPNAPATEIGPQGQTIAGDFPAAPEDSMFGPNAKRAIAGLMLGGPIGGLLGAASGMIGGLGGPAGVAQDHETFSAGYGLGGMQQGMYGPRGATGKSLSQPGVFSTSRGPNQGYDLNNQYGARTTYGPSGDIRANSGTMDAWGRVLGGLFDRPDKSKKGQSGKGGGLSQASRDAIGKGSGGLY